MKLQVSFPEKFQPMFQPKRYKILRGGRGSGKCFGLGTLIMMHSGELKKVEDIQVGELVMGPDSKPRKVLNVISGESDLYRVKQTSAIDYIVNEDHVLSLKKSLSCAKDVGVSTAGNPRRPRGRYPDYPDVVNIGLKDYLLKSKRWKEHFRGYRAGRIFFEEKQVPVDPYLLGLWLGDGLHRELMITSSDAEIVKWLREYADKVGAKLTESAKSGKSNVAKDYRILKKAGKENPIWQGFRKLGVVSNKHIPLSYIANSEHVRLELLAGIIDTDGSYSTHGYSVVSANVTLADDIKHLADTLGFRTSITKKQTKCGDYVGEAWNVAINGNVWDIPCRVERKKYKHNGIFPNKDKTLSYIEVEHIGHGPYAGFEVDGDHLFCLSDGTVTHNSWSVARALLVLGMQSKLRVLCVREVQISIRQSVHRLLRDQIERLNIGGHYTVTDTEISGRNGSLFMFSGLSTHTADTLKSYEGINICWVEEGQTISDRSWQILIPTIRENDSEIWVTYNPDLESDPTHQRFTMHQDDDILNIEMNWKDNPWWNDVLEKERIRCLNYDPDNYDNIWEGKCKPAVEGAIYFKQVQKMETEGRICKVPHDVLLKTHVVMDLGWEDSVAIGCVQRSSGEVRIIDYIEASHKTLAEYSAELRKRDYNWGNVYLPWDAFSASVASGKSSADVMYKLGWNVIPKDSLAVLKVEEGIKATRLVFPRLWIDKEKCARLIECIKRYRRSLNQSTGAFGSPLHDQYSHGADMLRYLCINIDTMSSSVFMTTPNLEPEYEETY